MRVTQEHTDARKRAIRDAATVVFARKGSEKATMQEIAKEANLSPGALYLYYPSKADILHAVCDEKAEHILEVFASAAAGAETPLDGLRRIADHMVEEIADTEFAIGMAGTLEMTLAAARDPEGIGKALATSMDAVSDQLASLMQLAQERGEIDPALDARSLGEVLAAFGVGMQLLHLQTQGQSHPAAAFATMFELVRRCAKPLSPDSQSPPAPSQT